MTDAERILRLERVVWCLVELLRANNDTRPGFFNDLNEDERMVVSHFYDDNRGCVPIGE